MNWNSDNDGGYNDDDDNDPDSTNDGNANDNDDTANDDNDNNDNDDNANNDDDDDDLQSKCTSAPLKARSNAVSFPGWFSSEIYFEHGHDSGGLFCSDIDLNNFYDDGDFF